LTLIAGVCSPQHVAAQTEAPGAAETILATIEGELTRENLNETRIALQEQGIRFQYGNFQFEPGTTNMVGAEIHVVIDGVEYHEFFEFDSPTCKLQVIKESGFRMEGC
jgi:hypothetical protein